MPVSEVGSTASSTPLTFFAFVGSLHELVDKVKAFVTPIFTRIHMYFYMEKNSDLANAAKNLDASLNLKKIQDITTQAQKLREYDKEKLAFETFQYGCNDLQVLQLKSQMNNIYKACSPLEIKRVDLERDARNAGKDADTTSLNDQLTQLSLQMSELQTQINTRYSILYEKQLPSTDLTYEQQAQVRSFMSYEKVATTISQKAQNTKYTTTDLINYYVSDETVRANLNLLL